MATLVFSRIPDESPQSLGSSTQTQSFDFTLVPERIQYSLTEQGLVISIELGAVLPRQARILQFLEYKLQLLQGS